LKGPSPTRLDWWCACVATTAAAIAWIFWYKAGLVLSHYDAKAHLVVARRVFDNLTPGWQQIGAVWLPLPHLINLLPTQIDFFYRTGLFASSVSIVCLGISAWAASRLIQSTTGSRLGAVTATLLLALNPNLLYLHATPMTEPLLIAITSVTVLWLVEWLSDDAGPPIPVRLHLVLFAAAWTRYEAWLVVAAAIGLALVVLWHRGTSLSRIIASASTLAAAPAAAALLFVLDSRITVGSWFVSNGFYVPDPTYEGLVAKSALAVWWGTHQLSGYGIEITALAMAALIVWQRSALTVAVALFAAGALPFYAFVEGHPFRIRYMSPLAAACAVFCGLAVGWLDRRASPAVSWRRAPLLLAGALVMSSIVESPPWSGSRAPVIEEAEWDVPVSIERRAVTACLVPAYRGEKIFASMSSLAHYMQELSSHGLAIADFINEGNGTIWDIALSTGPAPHAGWMLVEEHAEGGDVLAQRIRADATFAHGMTRICEGGGVALYRRDRTVAGSARSTREMPSIVTRDPEATRAANREPENRSAIGAASAASPTQ
jgi:hypothetical protein